MRYFLALALIVFLAAPAFAAFNGPGAAQQGGFKGPGAASAAEATVANAKSLPDDAIVTLKGNIVSKLANHKDKYVFRDSTGEIIVEIDDKYFAGRDVTPDNTVRITGEVEKDWNAPVEIDAKFLEILK